MLILSSQHFAIILFFRRLFFYFFSSITIATERVDKSFLQMQFLLSNFFGFVWLLYMAGKKWRRHKEAKPISTFPTRQGKIYLSFFPHRSVYFIVQGVFYWSYQKGAEDGKIVTKKSKLKLHISLLDGFTLTF